MADIEIPDPEELEELKGKKFTRGVALTTAIYAVMLAITSLGGNNAMKGMLLAQQQSSDQWAFYQSKVVREHLYKLQRLQLETNLLEKRKSMGTDLLRHYDETIRRLQEEENRYKTEKKAIEAEAKKQEAERDVNNRKDPYFDYAEVLLQIAIVLASISILSGSAQVFYLSVIAAGLGSLLSVNGFLLLIRIPFLH
ncbi:MAG: DUF4337 domain-containing protein [Nitrospirae bacterium]|nr:MAG: DUF4337 domain-containing protein [Nitrospirota bacterium]